MTISATTPASCMVCKNTVNSEIPNTQLIPVCQESTLHKMCRDCFLQIANLDLAQRRCPQCRAALLPLTPSPSLPMGLGNLQAPGIAPIVQELQPQYQQYQGLSNLQRLREIDAVRQRLEAATQSLIMQGYTLEQLTRMIAQRR